MTAEEAVKTLRGIKPKDQGYCNGGIELLNNYGGLAIETAIEALEKADKYRWHDLKKNPKDLPEQDGNYIVCLRRSRHYGYDVYKFSTDFRDYRGARKKGFCWYDSEFGYIEATDVIAWKEIETFEKKVSE